MQGPDVDTKASTVLVIGSSEKTNKCTKNKTPFFQLKFIFVGLYVKGSKYLHI